MSRVAAVFERALFVFVLCAVEIAHFDAETAFVCVAVSGFDFFARAIRPLGEICDTQGMVILMRNGGGGGSGAAIIGLVPFMASTFSAQLNLHFY